MKYEEEANNILNELFRESWMDDDDWDGFINDLFKLTGLSVDKLSEQLEQGVNNGYSVEKQIEILKLLFKK
jgi:hypothetical protein